VALQLATAGRYGIFRDEYYYLMCAAHPAWGYVDHPPLAMIFLKLWTALFGDSILALRTPPALLNGAVAVGAAALARELRGGAPAQMLAAIAVGLMPGLLALGGFFSMNPFDVAFWVLAAWVVCRLLDPDGDRRWWWALGVVLGLGLLNKYSVVFLAGGVGVGILLSPLRRDLMSLRPWIGIVLAMVIVAPHLVWQADQGWPTIEFVRNAHDLKNVAMSPAEFWGQQLLMAHPVFAPLWLIGALGLLLLPRLRRWRPLGVAFAVVGTWLTVQHAKPYYLVPAYPMAMAAGAVVVTGWLARWRRVSAVTVVALPVLCALAGLAIAPLAIPVLEPSAYVAYEQIIGLRPKQMEHNEVGDLPQHFADRFGWRELAGTVSAVVEKLPRDERSRTLVVTGNYGECGAINYWGLPEGTPPAVSGQNSCFTWWPAEPAPATVILIGVGREYAERLFVSVELGAVHRNALAMPYERELAIWICRGWKVDPDQARAEARFAI
jgi:hypothetical protein